MPGETERQPPAHGEGRYYAVVGALLVLIVVMLAVLWLRERRAVWSLRAQLRQAQRRAAVTSGLQALLGRPGGAGPTTRPLAREDLPAETVQWNGRPRTVLRLGATAGRRLGLEPGDVLLVAPAAGEGPDGRR